MDNRKLVESQVVAEETKGSDGDRHQSVKLVEMGQVSVETKGTVRGLELTLTPKN